MSDPASGHGADSHGADGHHGAIIGRTTETSEIRRVIANAAAGYGQSLVLLGDAGIGKSTLLRAVPALVPDGTVVVSVSAVESETHLAYVAAIDLVGPLLELDEVTAGLAGDGRRVLDDLVTARPHPGGPMQLCRAVLGAVLAACAGGRLIVFVVDDVQWLDEPSAEVLLYVARRIGSERVAILAGARAGTPSRLLDCDLPRLRVGGLSASEVDRLLAPHHVHDRVAAGLHEATGGNPLAVLEIVRTLSADERSAKVAIPLFPEIGATITNVLGRRVGSLPVPVREALVVVAAHGSGHSAVLYAALAELGHDPSVLMVAEEHQIITIRTGSVTFVHPLLRLVAYSSASPVSRHCVHAALAAAWWGEQPCRGAWHLAESAAGPDEAIASSMETAVLEARGHCAAAIAGELLRRAGDLSTDPVGRERRWMAAALRFGDAARPSLSASVLREVLASTTDPRLRADAAAMYGLYVAFSESPVTACEFLRTEAARISADDPSRAMVLLVTAYSAALLAVDMNVASEIVADAGLLAVGAGPVGMLILQSMQMQDALFAGRSAEALRLLGPIEQLATAMAPTDTPDVDRLLQSVAMAHLVLDRWQDAQTTVAAVLRRGRAAGRDGSLAFAYAVASEAALRLGRWPQAYVDARRAGDLYADPADRDWATLSSLALCARVEAHLGLGDECREHGEAVVAGAGAIGSALLVLWARHALGLLALSLGDHGEAVRQLELVADIADRSGVHDPGYICWPGDLLEAYWRSRRIAEAMRVRSRLEAHAHVSGRLSVQMVVARADALLGSVERAEDSFARSLELGHRLGAPFEIARTQMLQAEWRILHGVQAAEPLDAAVTAFERLGAKVWATRCRVLLPGAGAPASVSPSRLLADRELEAALLAARGFTNREIADELYLSPKTVENTLGKVYRKLAVRSRTQLAILLLSSAG